MACIAEAHLWHVAQSWMMLLRPTVAAPLSQHLSLKQAAPARQSKMAAELANTEVPLRTIRLGEQCQGLLQHCRQRLLRHRPRAEQTVAKCESGD